MSMQKTWRWFGENDPAKLPQLKQMGVEGIVTSLHHIPSGAPWDKPSILKVKEYIESFGLHWSVVESLPVAEGIKTHSSDYDRLVSHYITSLQNLGECGLDTVCYNFMPVLDWARTDLHYPLPDGGEVMYFDFPTFAAFDIYILQRPHAERDYPQKIVEKSSGIFEKLTEEAAERLAYNIIVYTQGFIHGNIPGHVKNYKEVFLGLLAKYEHIGQDKLRANLRRFLSDVLPTAEKYGIKMCIHPDDPPMPLLGLPRIVSTEADLEWIFQTNPSPSNGLTFCSGSLSARRDNHLESILTRFAPRTHFLHLRNNRVFDDGSFHESGHIDGDVNLPALIKIVLEEQQRRISAGASHVRLPVRPDHGIKMLDDATKDTPPGYPIMGRFRGLMEIRGMEAGIEKLM